MKITSVFCIAVAGAMVIAPAFAAQKTASPLEISRPWSRATPPGATTGAGYLAITNPGKTPDEKQQWNDGLRSVLKELRQKNIKDPNGIAQEIAKYRRQFLDDDTRVVNL